MSLLLWIVGAFFLTLRWLWHKYMTHRHIKKWLWPVPYLMLAVGVVSLLFAPLPFGWGTAAGVAAALWSYLFSALGVALAGRIVAGLALIVVLIAGFGDLLKDRKPDEWARSMLVAAPVLALAAGGSLAAEVLHWTHLVGNVGPNIVQGLT